MNITELFSNPSMMHAAVVHIPIAGVVFGLLFIGLSAIFHRNNSVRAVTALLFLIAAGSAYLAIETGEDARDLVPNTLPGAVWDHIDQHVDAAHNVMYSAIVTFVLMLIALIRVDAVRITGLILAAIAAIITCVFVVQAGHLGGELVYDYGVGTPLVKEPPATPPPAPENAEQPTAETPATENAPMPTEKPAEPVAAADPKKDKEEDEPPIPIRPFTPEEAAAVSYIHDIWPIIDDKCIDCHEEPDPDGDFIMTTVAETLKGGKKAAPGFIPGNPDESSMVKYVRGLVHPRMPDKDPPLSEDEVHLIRMWIAAGAVDDTNAGPAPEMKEEPAASEPSAADAPAAATAPEPAPAETAVEESATAATPTEPVNTETKTEESTPTAEPAATETKTEESAPAAEPTATEAGSSDTQTDSATSSDAAAGESAPAATTEPAATETTETTPQDSSTDDTTTASPETETTATDAATTPQ